MRFYEKTRLRLRLLSGALLFAFAGCTHVSHLAVLSDGNLYGRQLTRGPDAEEREGEDCGMSYYLANAFRDAVKDSNYDTLVDVDVTSTAGLTPFQQCIKVKGWAVRSVDLPQTGE